MSRTLGTEAEVLALSPDASSSKAAQGLRSPSKWPMTGSDGDAVWGECQGSGSKPYQTQVDLAGPAFKCSCPSRKFPCKHGLALLLLRAAGQVAEGGARPQWVADWHANRQAKAEKNERKAAVPLPSGQDLARRDEPRWSRIAAGTQELALWMQDLVRQGLASQAQDAQAQGRWQNIAARMVDAQAPGLAARIRDTWSLVGCHAEWHRDVLHQMAHWQLLCEAVQRHACLPAPTKADVMAALGWPQDRAEILASGESVEDAWRVVGMHAIEREGRLWERRVWLQGLETGRIAWLLDHSHGGRGYDTVWLIDRSYRCQLHYYPSGAPLRAFAPQGNAGALLPTPGLPLTRAVAASPLQDLARRVSGNPLQSVLPMWCGDAHVHCVQGRWTVEWPQGAGAVPVSAIADEALWRLLALTGGMPMQLFGEWDGRRWLLLSAWQPATDSDAAAGSGHAPLQCVWHHLGDTV